MNSARASSSPLERLARSWDAEALADEPLAPKTSIRVGGRAELFVRPRSVDGLLAVLKDAGAENIPLTALGGGANSLVGDGGVPGITLKLPADLSAEEIRLSSSEGRLTLGAGAAIARLIQLAKQNGLVGAEFLAGIPGTIGGATAMNAGTKMGECMSVVEAVEIADAEGIGATVFQAGTRMGPHGLETAGGRVLGVTAGADDLPRAIDRAYRGVSRIQFEAMHFRTDIGRKGLRRYNEKMAGT